MERVFKIKTRTEPEMSNQYPSERRYSASIVLGLTTVYLTFCLFSILLGALVVHKINVLGYAMDPDTDALNFTDDERFNEELRLAMRIAKDLEYSDNNYLHYAINIPGLIAWGCFVMAIGNLLTVVTGLLAWKRWYIDQNITFFFVACCASTLMSSVSFVISIITTYNINFVHLDSPGVTNRELSPVSIGLAVNIIILSLLNTVWSSMSGKFAYNGMRSRYPDDIMDRRGQVSVVKTTRKGNSGNISSIPVEVINHAAMGKMLKYLPRVGNDDLPKEESNAEYQQRVDQFLNGHSEAEHLEQPH